MYMLVWLKSLTNINASNLRTTIPDDHTYLAYLVRVIFIFHNIFMLFDQNKSNYTYFYNIA